jgi:hypothetical protein
MAAQRAAVTVTPRDLQAALSIDKESESKVRNSHIVLRVAAGRNGGGLSGGPSGSTLGRGVYEGGGKRGKSVVGKMPKRASREA